MDAGDGHSRVAEALAADDKLQSPVLVEWGQGSQRAVGVAAVEDGLSSWLPVWMEQKLSTAARLLVSARSW